MNLADLDAIVKDLIDLSRPTSKEARWVAINHGYREASRAISAARPEAFLQEAMVELPANTLRFALTGSEFVRPVQRVAKIVGLGPSAANLSGSTSAAGSRVLKFRYASITSEEFRAGEALGATDVGEVLYDMVLPNGVPTLALAPALSTPVLVLVSTIYRPVRLAADAAVVEAVIEQHQELVIAYAMQWLLRTVNDAEASGWGAQATELRAELTQDVSKVSEEGTEAFGSDCYFGDD